MIKYIIPITFLWRARWGGKPLVRDFRENSAEAYIQYQQLKDKILERDVYYCYSS